MITSPRFIAPRQVASAVVLLTALFGVPVATASQTIPISTTPQAATIPSATTIPPATTEKPVTTPATTPVTAGKPTTTKPVTTKAAATIPPASTLPPIKASKRNSKGQWSANGRPPGPAIPFSATPGSSDKSTPSAANEADAYKAIQPDGKVLFFLVIGSDARPGEKVDRSRSDACHLFAYNPALKAGAFVGFPRDSWVTSPAGVQRKLSGVMSTEGPDAVVKTVSKLMNVPVTRFAVTGFDGFTKMVQGIGGVPIEVNPAMNDKYSGAQFQQGWFQMNGEAALAFNRARKTLPRGDISRSANQEKFILATLTKLRSTTANVQDLTKWVGVAKQNTVTNIRPGDWLYFAQLARSIDPGRIRTTVVPGKSANINKQSVVQIDQAQLAALSKDIQDGVLGN
jgi:polyisoprenyl-teichoic acid--peptidoglycan teichoic acid transferase